MSIRGFFDDVKIAMVYVGTIIGAGFATGREIALYFGGYGFFTALCGGLSCGLLCFLFMLVGKRGVRYIGEKSRKTLTIGASIITLAAMTSAINELLTGYGVMCAGVMMCVICLFFTGRDGKWLKNANTIIIFAVIGLLIFLAVKKGEAQWGGKISIFRGVSYAAMNILLTSELATDYGRGRGMKSIANISIITGVVLSALILIIFSVIGGNITDPMPVYSVAESINLAPLAIIVIGGAIFTTMLSAVVLLERETATLIKEKSNRVMLIILASIIFGYFSFSFIVNNFYHLLSIGGGVMSALAIIGLFLNRYSVDNRTHLPANHNF